MGSFDGVVRSPWVVQTPPDAGRTAPSNERPRERADVPNTICNNFFRKTDFTVLHKTW